jgi:uncharacterized membrane protein
VNRLPGRLASPAIRLHPTAASSALAVVGWLVLAVTLLVGQPIRTIVVFAFVLTGPGIAIIRLLPLRDPLEKAVLALALGMSLAALVAEAVAIAHVLRPTLALAILAALCTAAALTEMTRAAKRRVPS